MGEVGEAKAGNHRGADYGVADEPHMRPIGGQKKEIYNAESRIENKPGQECNPDMLQGLVAVVLVEGGFQRLRKPERPKAPLSQIFLGLGNHLHFRPGSNYVHIYVYSMHSSLIGAWGQSNRSYPLT